MAFVAGGSSLCAAQPAVALETLRAHSVRQAATWTDALARPLAERVRAAPDAVVEYLHLDNAFNGFAERPIPWTPGGDEAAAIVRAMASLPPRVLELVSASLAGVFFVERLGGSGYTETVDRTPGGEELAFVVFDRVVLTRRANAWATWKESTVFREGRHRVEIRIAHDDADDIAGAFRFILLHELGHVIGASGRHHPSWLGFKREGAFPFHALAWTATGERREPAFPHRLRYYAPVDARADDALLPLVWRDVAASAFPTLYATTTPYDDFAESFASYVHLVLLGAPWVATVYDDREVVATIANGMAGPRSATRRAYFDRMFGR